MAKIDTEIRGLTDKFHLRKAQEVIQTAGRPPVELALDWAQDGRPQLTADYLWWAKELNEREKIEILATAYENRAARERAMGEEFQTLRGADDGFFSLADDDLSKAKRLRECLKSRESLKDKLILSWRRLF